MGSQKQKNVKMIILFISGFVFFNFPLMSIFSKNKTILSVPVLYTFIYILWLILIIITFLIIKLRPADSSGEE